MKESDWRSKLVKMFSARWKNVGFIWVNDVRYKAGYPDIYIALNGMPRHYELKLSNKSVYDDFMSPLQVAVCKRIAMAGVYVSCLTKCPQTNLVSVKRFNNDGSTFFKVMYNEDFESKWVDGILI